MGIDFGTTNSAVAVWKEGDDRVLAGDYEPTLLYFEPGNEPVYHIGHTALEKFIESGLKGRFIRSIKSILHLSTFKYTMISGTRYSADDLVSLILTHLKKKAEAMAGHGFDRVTLGRPAKFSPNPEKDALAQDRLLKAAHKAGFTDVQFQLEPIAAAYLYEREARREELVLVGDLGGGTADFTLILSLANKTVEAMRRKRAAQDKADAADQAAKVKRAAEVVASHAATAIQKADGESAENEGDGAGSVLVFASDSEDDEEDVTEDAKDDDDLTATTSGAEMSASADHEEVYGGDGDCDGGDEEDEVDEDDYDSEEI